MKFIFELASLLFKNFTITYSKSKNCLELTNFERNPLPSGRGSSKPYDRTFKA